MCELTFRIPLENKPKSSTHFYVLDKAFIIYKCKDLCYDSRDVFNS